MRALKVVEVKVTGKATAGFAGRSIIVQVHFLVLDGTPEPFGEDIICRSAAAIHADLDTCERQAVEILRAGKMAALVTIPNGGDSLLQGSIHGG